MAHVASRDGTLIEYDRAGSGPAVVLVGGGLDDGSENAPLFPALAGELTVVNYRRRGRGGSGDVRPYALEREIEDLAALIAEVGGPAHLFGASSGGALALEAAAAGLPIARVAVYEVPYAIGEEAIATWREYVARLRSALAAGERQEALALFMRLAGSSEEDLAAAQGSPMWPALLDLAHTLAYDAACLGDGPPPAARLATITRPTLVVTGAGVDPHMAGLSTDFFGLAADAITACIPDARRHTIDRHGHTVDPETLVPLLTGFFYGEQRSGP
ncbi:alpha/beta fold hydrolase [Thermomonospora umbrina]|uniref:Pimeloyl-ACP methyl ester carboxylesterase n=1 Tax=Thermomonospora umbrina TaxID=111806 RepID=A0A3D9SMM8_9ACTN|nr:alpha/beta fold hydrolase [Thermomonospora umbrina]REE96987.1 pimeloyl-ACP methyl ester carboxylesterase [Thermomonospora umbrina]